LPGSVATRLSSTSYFDAGRLTSPSWPLLNVLGALKMLSPNSSPASDPPADVRGAPLAWLSESILVVSPKTIPMVGAALKPPSPYREVSSPNRLPPSPGAFGVAIEVLDVHLVDAVLDPQSAVLENKLGDEGICAAVEGAAFWKKKGEEAFGAAAKQLGFDVAPNPPPVVLGNRFACGEALGFAADVSDASPFVPSPGSVPVSPNPRTLNDGVVPSKDTDNAAAVCFFDSGTPACLNWQAPLGSDDLNMNMVLGD
jgi:hypothetical protein